MILKLNNSEGFYLGFDISTTCIGISVLNEVGEIHELSHLELKSDKDVHPENRYIAKANAFKDYIQKYKCLDKPIKGIFIEDALNGSVNTFTVAMLLRFNAICSYILYSELMVIPEYITIHEVRKTLLPEYIKTTGNKQTLSIPKELDKKVVVREKLCKLYSDIPTIYDKKGGVSKFNFDISDALAVNYSSLLKKGYITKNISI